MSRARDLFFVTSVCLSASLLAQEPGGQPPPDLDEIVVTAQKRSERVNDVPLSITAVSGDKLAEQGVTSASDLERVVPGFTFQPSSRLAPVFSIRGIGFYDTSISNSPAVTVYLDQVPLPFLAMTEGVSFDLERVEVLKGPQGTLFGQNSTGGAVNYIAAKPTHELSAGLQTTYGRFQETDAEGFVSGPISDTLGYRVAVRTEQRGDWQHSYTRNDTLGQRDLSMGRLLLDWHPSSDLGFELNVNGWQDKSDTQAGQYLRYTPTNPAGRPEQAAALPNYPRAPGDIQSADWNSDEYLKRNDRMYQVSLRGDLNIRDSATLTSITAYSNYTADSPLDADATSFNDIYLTTVGYLRSFSQELRVANSAEGRFKWIVGANVQQDRTLDNEIIYALGSNQSAVGLPWYGFSQYQRQKVDTYSGFANLQYEIASQVSVTAAARYSKQDRDAHGCLADINGTLAATFSRLSSILSGSPTVIAPDSCVTLGSNLKPVGEVHGVLDQSNVSWRGGIDWKPLPDTLIYANVTKGFKSGGFDTLPAIRDTQLTPVTQESLLAYEVGFKGPLVSRRATLTGAVFYYDYSDKQLTGYINVGPPFGTLPGLVSIPKSSVKGAELDLTVRPLSDLSVMLGGTYVSSKVDRDFSASDPFGASVDIKGQAFPNTPKWAAIADTEYGNTFSFGRLFVGGGARYRSASYAAFGNNPDFKIRSYALLDLRAGYESPDDRWRVMAWGKNVLDRRYTTSTTRPIDTVVAYTGMPATFGVTAGYRF
jgi:iron complex outermembrane receptor protein